MSEALSELLEARHSCRAYLTRPVSRGIIDHMLRMSQRTASWCNAQPWQVHVLSAPATERARSALLEHVGKHPPNPDLPFPESYQGRYLERRRECGWQLYNAVGVERGDRAGADRQRIENFRFFGAPHVALVTSDRALGIYGAIDCGAFVSMFMLAGQSLGIASIAQAALASHSEFWRAHLGLCENRAVVCGISFGYEDCQHPANSFRTARATVDESATWIE
jgi:nitroreductase